MVGFEKVIVLIIFILIDAGLLGHMIHSIKKNIYFVAGIDLVLGGLMFAMLAQLIFGGV